MADKTLGISLEDALCRFLTQLDTQVAREMQRTPAEREELGVQKWQPYRKRVERVTTTVLDQFGSGALTLDGVLIAAEAFSKILRILAEELEEEGLGEIRSGYLRAVFDSVSRDCALAKTALQGGNQEEFN